MVLVRRINFQILGVKGLNVLLSKDSSEHFVKLTMPLSNPTTAVCLFLLLFSYFCGFVERVDGKELLEGWPRLFEGWIKLSIG